MVDQYLDIIRRHSQELAPIPTHQESVLRSLDDIRAVFFDVYGTMFVSSSGDIGAGTDSPRSQAAEAAIEAAFPTFLQQCGFSRDDSLGQSISQVHYDCIHAAHARKQAGGVEYPEVDIVEIWRETLGTICSDAGVAGVEEGVDCERLALEFELRVNPVWPMPGLIDCLESLCESGVTLGVISNAQFFTPLLFPALLNVSPNNLAFDSQMQYYSYRFGEAKPSQMMYQKAAEALADRGISPDQVVYVGNDMLNDVMPASRQGFRTALFAGDQRSLRLRDGDPRIVDVNPDLVVADLTALTRCVKSNRSG